VVKETEDYQLHGACMFFANEYLKKFDGLYDGTFMYGEEFILKYIVQSESMKMLYLNDLEVFHKEGASTKKMWGKGRKQRQFFYKWSVKSLKLLSEMMRYKDRKKTI
jgi:GT2 family glycosyltransferase